MRDDEDSFGASVAKELSKDINQSVYKHVLAQTAAGARNLSMTSKMHCVLHQMHLIPFGWHMVSWLCSSVDGCCTDSGTEKNASKHVPVNPNPLLPGWDESGAVADDDTSQPIPFNGNISFDCIQIEGIEHLSHNSVQQLSGAMKRFTKWLSRATSFARCLTDAYCCDRVVWTCLE